MTLIHSWFTCSFPIKTSRTGRRPGRPSTMSTRLTRVKFRLGEIFGRPPRLKAGLKNSEVAQRRLLPHEHPACRRREPGVRSGYCRRLTANLNSSYSPAVVARHDAMLDEVAIAAPFRIVAAEAGRVAAHAGASGHHRWLNQADSRQCEHGYNRFPHRASLHSVTPVETTLSRRNYSAVEHCSR